MQGTAIHTSYAYVHFLTRINLLRKVVFYGVYFDEMLAPQTWHLTSMRHDMES